MASRLPAQTSTNGGGMLGDLKRARREGGASITELREVVSQMRGRSPQEVLGMVSASELIRGIIISTIGTVLFFAVFTVGPYLFKDEQTAKKAGKKTPAAEANNKTDAAPVEAAAMASTEPDAAAAAKALNIDEVKTADPNVNPLDTNIDKLLDGKE